MNDQTQGQSLEAQIARLQGDLTGLVNLIYRKLEEMLAPFELSVAEYSVVLTCFDNRPITVNGINERVPLDLGRVSRMVSKLEDMGLVRKTRLRDDRRVVYVELTEEGDALAQDLIRRAEESYAGMMSKVSEEELTALMVFIEKMTANAKSANVSDGEDSEPM